jgi:hypothetical protein
MRAQGVGAGVSDRAVWVTIGDALVPQAFGSVVHCSQIDFSPIAKS